MARPQCSSPPLCCPTHLLQALLFMPLYGSWGLRMYGPGTFKRVDMLKFHLARCAHALTRELILEGLCKKPAFLYAKVQ